MMKNNPDLKYKVYNFLTAELEKDQNKYFSVRDIAKSFGLTDSNFWNERYIRNSIIELISENMLDTTIKKNIGDWRLLVKAKKQKEEVPQ